MKTLWNTFDYKVENKETKTLYQITSVTSVLLNGHVGCPVFTLKSSLGEIVTVHEESIGEYEVVE